MSNNTHAITDGMTYVEKLDFSEQAHRHEIERIKIAEEAATTRAKYELRAERQDTYKVVGVALAIAAVVLAIVAAIYFYNVRPDDTLNGEERREIACTENGGAFIPERMLEDSANVGLCVYPKGVQ
jgi:hypothetical protein